MPPFFQVSYTAKDLILYALSLGMGSTTKDSEELKYLYEQHDEFSAVSTFYLAFTFWAVENGNNATNSISAMIGIPPFPPPIMAKEQVIPRRFLRDKCINLSDFPVIHTWQSILWHEEIRMPNRPPPGMRHDDSVIVNVDMKVISVQPKSIGTFVTSQTNLRDAKRNSSTILASMLSTALVMGISSDDVIYYNDAGVPRQSMLKNSLVHTTNRKQRKIHQRPDFEWSNRTTPQQALLYRVASGDSNHIHVDTSVSEQMGATKNKPAPIMHGLFTLALAYRGILKFVQQTASHSSTDKVFFRKLEGRFTRPVFVGDALCVRIWQDTFLKDEDDADKASVRRFAFVIVNQKTEKIVVDGGCAQVEIKCTEASSGRRISRL